MVHSVDPFSQFKLATMRLPEYSERGALVYVAYYLPLLLLVFALLHWRPLASSADRCRLRRFVLPLSFAQTLLLAIMVFHPLDFPFLQHAIQNCVSSPEKKAKVPACTLRMWNRALRP